MGQNTIEENLKETCGDTLAKLYLHLKENSTHKIFVGICFIRRLLISSQNVLLVRISGLKHLQHLTFQDM